MDHEAVGEERHVAAIPENGCLVEVKRRILIGNDGRRIAAEADIGRSLDVVDSQGSLIRFPPVTRRNDHHMRDDPHEGDIFQSLMRSPVRADGNAGMGPAEFDVEVIIADGIADLPPGSACQKDAIRRNKRYETGQRQTGRCADQVLFRNTNIDIFFRIFMADPFGPRRFSDVRIEDQDIVMKTT